MSYPKAQYAMGFVSYEHHNNEGQAFNWWRKAAEQGETNAQYMLGILYLYGYGRSYNGTEAKKWFERAAAKGNPHAKARLNKIGVLNKVRAVPLVKWVMQAPPGAPLPG